MQLDALVRCGRARFLTNASSEIVSPGRGGRALMAMMSMMAMMAKMAMMAMMAIMAGA